MEEKNLKPLFEAILFASGDPVDLKTLCSELDISEETAENTMKELAEKFLSEESGLEIIKLDGKFQMVTKSRYANDVRKVLAVKKNAPLSPAAFEVLAAVAYNQPVTRSFVEQIRGVDSSGVMNTLCERNLIEEAGRLDLPGRPLLYRTTDNFLRCFGLSSLDDLPPVSDSDLGYDDKNDGLNPEKNH